MLPHPFPDRFKPLPMLGKNSCFGCGSSNALGLGMSFYSDGKTVASSLVVPEHLCGWRQVVHGGIVATILDEIMGWSAIYLTQKVALTKQLTVHFMKPTMVGQPLFVEGWLVDRTDDRHVLIHGEIRTPEKEISARGEGLFTLFPLDEGANLGLFDPDMIAELRDMLFSSPL